MVYGSYAMDTGFGRGWDGLLWVILGPFIWPLALFQFLNGPLDDMMVLAILTMGSAFGLMALVEICYWGERKLRFWRAAGPLRKLTRRAWWLNWGLMWLVAWAIWGICQLVNWDELKLTDWESSVAIGIIYGWALFCLGVIYFNLGRWLLRCWSVFNEKRRRWRKGFSWAGLSLLLLWMMTVVWLVVSWFLTPYQGRSESTFAVLHAAIKNTCLSDSERENCPQNLEEISYIEPEEFADKLGLIADSKYAYDPESGQYTWLIKTGPYAAVLFDQRLKDWNGDGMGEYGWDFRVMWLSPLTGKLMGAPKWLRGEEWRFGD